eukprot:1188172-Prorocentrum_minimum.AAC.6
MALGRVRLGVHIGHLGENTAFFTIKSVVSEEISPEPGTTHRPRDIQLPRPVENLLVQWSKHGFSAEWSQCRRLDRRNMCTGQAHTSGSCRGDVMSASPIVPFSDLQASDASVTSTSAQSTPRTTQRVTIPRPLSAKPVKGLGK